MLKPLSHVCDVCVLQAALGDKRTRWDKMDAAEYILAGNENGIIEQKKKGWLWPGRRDRRRMCCAIPQFQKEERRERFLPYFMTLPFFYPSFLHCVSFRFLVSFEEGRYAPIPTSFFLSVPLFAYSVDLELATNGSAKGHKKKICVRKANNNHN